MSERHITISNSELCIIVVWSLSLRTRKLPSATVVTRQRETPQRRSALGCRPAGAATVEAAVAERDAAGVTPGGQSGGRTACGEEPRDGLTADVQDLGIQRGGQPAQREPAGAF